MAIHKIKTHSISISAKEGWGKMFIVGANGDKYIFSMHKNCNCVNKKKQVKSA